MPAVSDPLEEAAPTAALSPPAEARAARLAKFKREQLIVDYLNRGVSVVEIAARVGLGEKRMRAIIREILARRMPHPPEEFVAIQYGRLNEALLIAFSAMSPTNLKAVDQVVKIVRELDRYGGACAAEWARPNASLRIARGSQAGAPALEAPVEGASAFGIAWVCRAEFGLQDDANPLSRSPDRGRRERPGNPAQSLEKIELGRGVEPAPEGDVAIQGSPAASGSPRFAGDDDGHPLSCSPERGRRERPGNPPQSLENIESAPGIGLSSQTAEAAPADPLSTPDLNLRLLRSATGRMDLRLCLSRFRAGTYGVAAKLGGGDPPFAAPAGRDRPENPAPRLENIDSVPGKDGLDGAGSGSLPSPLVPCPIRPENFPMAFDGARAC